MVDLKRIDKLNKALWAKMQNVEDTTTAAGSTENVDKMDIDRNMIYFFRQKLIVFNSSNSRQYTCC
jgi:hypothetical protein